MRKQKDLAPPSRLPWVLAAAVVTALAILATAVIYSLSGDDVAARWETSDSMTANPWTPSVVKPGTPLSTPGKFVGTATVTSVASEDCDKEALKQHLASNPKLAQNWAQVLDISVTDINPYIDKLRSRRLTVPVQVTNHDYEGDQARELQSVLDAGTAVLADADGAPRVRCACGNPLKPASTKATKFDDLPPDADPDSVVTYPTARPEVGTAIRVVNRPLIASATEAQPAPGYTATDYTSRDPISCVTGFIILYGKSAARCFINESIGHCWPDGIYIYCQQDATKTNLWKLKVEEWAENREDNPYRNQPDTVELVNGLVCYPSGRVDYEGSQREGVPTRYGCFNGDLGSDGDPRPILRMWGGVKRDGSVWTVRIGKEVSPAEPSSTLAPLTTVDVRVAYYAIDE